MKRTKKEEKNKLEYLKSERGITLIALVITIIVLLILAGVSIATLTGDNGILTRASDAKIETVVATVKENLHLEQIEKAIDEEEVTPETLLAEGKVKRTVQQAEDENYYMYYALKEDVIEGMQGLGKGNVASLRDVFLIDDDLNVKYIAKNGKEYGDELEEKILRDETKIRFASKAFSEYVSKISGATEDEMKFEWMKNQTSLNISDSNIDSLEDLVFFPNLENLYLNNLTLETLEGIENCKKLTLFEAKMCIIKDYSNIVNLNNLKSFTSNGRVEEIEKLIDYLAKMDSLTSVGIIYTNLTDMNKVKKLENLNNLKTLDLSQNSFTKIEGLENMKNLEKLNLWRNRTITDITGLEKLVNLKSLNLEGNAVSDITPLSKNTSLTYLNLKDNSTIDGNRANYTGERLDALNKIGEILDRGGSILLDADKLGLFQNYRIINLNSQNLTSIEMLKGMTKLEELYLDDNKIDLADETTKEVLRSMTSLRRLDLRNNQLKDISILNEIKTLRYLYMADNSDIDLSQIEDIISNCTIRVSTKALKTIVNCSEEKITKINITISGLVEIPDLSKFTNLTNLNLSGNPNILGFETVSKITSLQNLNLSSNNLHGRIIDFSNLTNLTNLNLSNNTLWSEDLENLKVLRNNSNLTIDLSNNSIIDATALLELNSNTKIKLTGNINLSQDSKDKLKERFGNNVTF